MLVVRSPPDVDVEEQFDAIDDLLDTYTESVRPDCYDQLRSQLYVTAARSIRHELRDLFLRPQRRNF